MNFQNHYHISHCYHYSVAYILEIYKRRAALKQWDISDNNTIVPLAGVGICIKNSMNVMIPQIASSI
jgi:hypothetical protein